MQPQTQPAPLGQASSRQVLPSHRVVQSGQQVYASRPAAWSTTAPSQVRTAQVRTAAPALSAALPECSEEEEEEDEIPSELGQEPGNATNLAALLPIETLQQQYPHNANLQQQFGELARSFKAWRPVRGDGNCYYRAVLFAWLERSLAVGTVRHAQSLAAQLKPHRDGPFGNQARICRRLLKAWAAQRARCSSNDAVRLLLRRVTDEFNKARNDAAFIVCLRQLIAQYVRAHAGDPVGSQGDQSNILTYETWARAISGARSLDEYCEQYICCMNKDAADHVQWVCPQVLQTVVRICMVDRETASCTFIDYGQGTAVWTPGSRSREPVKTAAQLATATGQRAPEIFLLLKPGHYDILVARDQAGQLLEPTPLAEQQAPPSGVKPGVGWGRASLEDVASGFRAVLRCLEEKLVEELQGKRQRLGSCDESLFLGQLVSVLEPLHELLHPGQVEPGSALRSLLPLLDRFLSAPAAVATNGKGPSEPSPPVKEYPAQSLTVPQTPSQVPGSICCICRQPNPAAVAACGCGYHLSCFQAYLRDLRTRGQQPSCRFHQRLFSPDFLARYGGVSPSAPESRKLTLPPTSVLRASDLEDTRPPLSPSPERSISGRALPQSGNVGAALGVPCLICYGEDNLLKTLHCGFKVHVHCLKDFWCQKVTTLCRLTDIRCPAELSGCSAFLSESDLRGVISPEDLAEAQRRIKDVDDRNARLIEELRRQSEEYRPTFRCAICLVDHEVEGCCTLPCQHRFCFESLQYHFDLIVRERRLAKLTCPAEGCGYNLRSEESIPIFQQCLPEASYLKLLEFLTRDDPRIVDCRARGCEERVFVEEGDNFADLTCPRGHRFCAKCDNGPHPAMTCDARRNQLQEEQSFSEAFRQALRLGWKPCPQRCKYGGGYKSQEECDHVTCECGFEFCWDCGVDRRVPLAHDNRWHKPSCRYHTPYHEVAEIPRQSPHCPACRLLASAGDPRPCRWPADDGYPESYLGG
eukprot:s728_g3.t1